MLDIRLIRDEPVEVKRRLAARDPVFGEQVDEVLALDEERRRGETEKQALQGERNRLAKEIGGRRAKGENTEDQEQEARVVGERIAVLANDVEGMEERQRALLLALPNLPHDQCPEGSGALENPVVRSWGEPRTSGGELCDHMEIAGRLALLDFEAAATLSGSGFVVFRGAGARLERALIQFLLDLQTVEHGYTEISPPFVVRRECMTGTGQLPKFEDDMYRLEDGDLFLAPTAEVPVTNLHRESILGFGELPVRYAAYTPCFRREAGSAGRESRGLIRMHQFDKVELVQIAHPDASFAVLEELTGHAEAALQRLGLHYRVIELCAGDLGFSAAKTYDIEVWAPGQKAWLEVSSCSNFGDYQARRMGLRFKDENGKNRFCHTLNGSGTALPRLYVALLETWQEPDGSVSIPEALRPYFGADRIGPQPAG